jgi:hypothetical protein
VTSLSSKKPDAVNFELQAIKGRFAACSASRIVLAISSRRNLMADRLTAPFRAFQAGLAEN